VHASRQDHGFADCNFFRCTRKIRDNKHIYVITCKTFAEDGFSNLVLIFVRTCMIDVSAQICICIWVAMRKVHGIKVELGCVLERQAIVILAITIVVWLQRIDILVEDLVRAEFFVATKCR
jgi:hypothetical protein